MKNIGIYIHIPFCVKKCIYCDFVSYVNRESIFETYVDALLNEIKHANLANYQIDTVYIGGGTPSILDENYIRRIMKELMKYKCEKSEITIEVNPGTITLEKLKAYKESGINRLSIGLQSTYNSLLQTIR